MVFARERKKLSKNLDTVDSLKSRISGGTTEQHFWDIQTAVSRSATTRYKQSLYVAISSRNDSQFPTLIEENFTLFGHCFIEVNISFGQDKE